MRKRDQHSAPRKPIFYMGFCWPSNASSTARLIPSCPLHLGPIHQCISEIRYAAHSTAAARQTHHAIASPIRLIVAPRRKPYHEVPPVCDDHSLRTTCGGAYIGRGRAAALSRLGEWRAVVYRGSVSCVQITRSAPLRRARSSEISCRALQEFAAHHSGDAAKPYGRARQQKILLQSLATASARPPIRSAASMSPQRAPLLRSLSKSQNETELQ